MDKNVVAASFASENDLSLPFVASNSHVLDSGTYLTPHALAALSEVRKGFEKLAKSQGLETLGTTFARREIRLPLLPAGWDQDLPTDATEADLKDRLTTITSAHKTRDVIARIRLTLEQFAKLHVLRSAPALGAASTEEDDLAKALKAVGAKNLAPFRRALKTIVLAGANELHLLGNDDRPLSLGPASGYTSSKLKQDEKSSITLGGRVKLQYLEEGKTVLVFEGGNEVQLAFEVSSSESIALQNLPAVFDFKKTRYVCSIDREAFEEKLADANDATKSSSSSKARRPKSRSK